MTNQTILVVLVYVVQFYFLRRCGLNYVTFTWSLDINFVFFLLCQGFFFFHQFISCQVLRTESIFCTSSLVAQMVKNLPTNAGDPGSIPESGRSPGGGNGNPLQYSCLENFHGKEPGRLQSMWFAKSQTKLSDFTFTFKV